MIKNPLSSVKPSFVRHFLTIAVILLSVSALAQCEILNRLSPDGTMIYYIEPVNFYWTQSKSLKGGVVTDNETFYLGLQPFPFPDKATVKKMKDDLELKLSNDSVYVFQHFDTRYLKHDSVLQLLYLLDKKDLDDLLKFQAVSARINMQGSEGVRTYVFKLHKDAIQEQLSCLQNEKEKKKK